jgi:hypothetical protein
MAMTLAALSVVFGIIAVPVGFLNQRVVGPETTDVYFFFFLTPCLGIGAILIALLIMEETGPLRVKVMTVTGFVLGVLTLMYFGIVLATGMMAAQLLQSAR